MVTENMMHLIICCFDSKKEPLLSLLICNFGIQNVNLILGKFMLKVMYNIVIGFNYMETE